MLGFSKVIALEDFDDAELAGIVRVVCAHKIRHLAPGYPKGSEHRKDWEVAMAVRALSHFGGLGQEATVLGVAAGVEDTLFYLTTRAKLVFATDRYLMSGEWAPLAPTIMLTEPQALAPYAFDPRRLVVQHMDGRSLRYPDDMFDGIFSSGSIEHFGELQDAAYAAYEMGRVLKPGGVLSLSTEFRLTGPPGGIGWPGMTLLFSKETLERYIVEASGLELVDELDLTVTEATTAQAWDLGALLTQRAAAIEAEHRSAEPRPEFALWDFPHLVLSQDGYTFTSVHLTLRKTDRYPASDNAWARPPKEVLAAISAYNRQVIADLGSRLNSRQDPPAPEPALVPAAPDPLPAAQRSSPPHLILDQLDRLLGEIDAGREETEAAQTTIVRLGRQAARHRLAPDPTAVAVLDATELPARHPCDIRLGEGVAFTLLVDSPSARHLIQDPAGRVLDEHLLTLMLQLVSPGDRVLDLGAHLGLFSLAASAAGCAVLAVEASPVNAQLLRAAAWRNGYHRLHVVHGAVAAAAGTVEFVPNGPWGHVAWEPNPGAVRVPAITVDELVRAFLWETVQFVKIDVEGSEVAALSAAGDLLSGPTAPPVLYESNAHTLALAGSSSGALIGRLEQLGYVNYLVEPRRLIRIAATDIQFTTVVNCLAVKRRPPGLEGWVVSPGLTTEERLAQVESESRHGNPLCRRHLAAALSSADPGFLAIAQVRSTLGALRDDGDEQVRAAAAWSAPSPAGVPAR